MVGISGYKKPGHKPPRWILVAVVLTFAVVVGVLVFLR
jgi:hypothetical protein